jgi:lipid-binding SYLF domain-containing protein
MKRVATFLSIIIMFLLLTGFLSPKGSNPDEKRQTIQKMRNEALVELYKYAPHAKNEIRKAVGYAVFSNTGIHVILLSAANGWGVAHDNKIGKDTYMKMASGGVGIGLGVKDFRGIFIFSTEEALKHFVDNGWQGGAQADAAAKSEEKGGAVGAAIDVAPGIKLYQLTKNGLALQATIQGTKYWKDEKLN